MSIPSGKKSNHWSKVARKLAVEFMKPKKRLIFTLLYDDGNFSLSRNFALQRVGDFNWLESNYGFSQNASGIDELVVLDVSGLWNTHY